MTVRRLFAAMILPIMLGAAPAPLPTSAAASPAPGPKAEIGQPAPPFTLKTFAREDISLADMRGQVVVINYWATWCIPCRSEMPMMDAYFRANRARGLRMFGVQTEDSVPPFRLQAVSNVLAYPLTLQFKGRGYGILGGVPTTYVIDRAGIVRYAKAGAFTPSSFQAVLGPLLAEAPPP